MHQVSDDELLRRARGGEPEAFAALCERHRGRVWRAVSSVAPCSADAEDLAQDVFLRAYTGLSSYRGEASFSSWLTRIALNRAADYYKSAWCRRVFFWQTGTPPEQEDTSVLALSDEVMQRQQREMVRRAVAGLGVRERVPIWMIYFEEYSLAEVARLEQLPESTVRSRVKKGLRQLQLSLSDIENIEISHRESSDSAETHLPCLGELRL
jgi:RNA polymerase sigma-70 factor, ECF subfamily